jgi:hypothetical protein
MRALLGCLTLALIVALSGCGSTLQACIFSEMEVERLSYDGINFNLILVGNGSTEGRLYLASDRSIPLAPNVRMQKNFTNTGGPYIQQSYTGLEPGRYSIAVEGAQDDANRAVTFESGRSYMIQAECP